MNKQQITIGVMSDSHHDLNAIDDAVCAAGEVDCWFHAGDNFEDAAYLSDVSGKKVYAVPGNTDWYTDKPMDLCQELAGVRIFMTHGHKYMVKFSLDALAARAEQLDAKLIIYGHSHVGAEDTIDGRIFINPGSVSEPRDGLAPSFMKIKIINGKISVKRIFLATNNDKF